ncbi:MAG: hypothetical protein NHB15_15125 [Methanosarcina barkeri]|nr:hypothetical protein [Methanosarcina sp. ERenArc_MAG2]
MNNEKIFINSQTARFVYDSNQYKSPSFLAVETFQRQFGIRDQSNICAFDSNLLDLFGTESLESKLYWRGELMRKTLIILIVLFGVFLAIGCTGNKPVTPNETRTPEQAATPAEVTTPTEKR